jgi:hypothetical protein
MFIAFLVASAIFLGISSVVRQDNTVKPITIEKQEEKK